LVGLAQAKSERSLHSIDWEISHFSNNLTMSLSSLPPELTLLISSHLNSPKDLSTFLRTSQKFYHLLTNELYQNNVRSDGGSALLWYASRGDEVGVRNMLRAGANVNLRSPNRAQSTALLEAVSTKRTSVVQILLENGALPDMADARSRRPLVLATKSRSDVAITKLLLEHVAVANSVVLDKHAPLLEAVRSNQESKVVLLLKHGADAHILDSRTGMTLVHIAASKNATPGIINILIGSGIQVESQDNMGRTPLQVAADHSCTRARCQLNMSTPKHSSTEGSGSDEESYSPSIAAATRSRSSRGQGNNRQSTKESESTRAGRDNKQTSRKDGQSTRP
jgi:ankyrin repeat protein